MTQILMINRNAPRKPKLGDPCNGCGLCCAAETCPVGRIVFRQIQGPCPALIWDPTAKRYWCGLVRAPSAYLIWLPKAWAERLAPVFARWIAADEACDSSVEVLSDFPKDTVARPAQ
jgi:hypothetical protein